MTDIMDLKPTRTKKNREKAGQHELEQSGKRDIKQCILLVLECIHEQCVEGAIKQDLMYRCELNQHYIKQILQHLFRNRLIYQVDPLDDDERPYVTYFLTQKGHEAHKTLKSELEAIGYAPKLNKAKPTAGVL